MTYTQILIELQGPVAILTLNRPEKRNALSWELREELMQAIDQLGKEAAIKALVITGKDPAFCAGIDLQNVQHSKLTLSEHRRFLRQMQGRRVLALREMEKPVIAAVNGPAMGGGCEIALACDLRVASDRAVFGESFVNIGLVPDGGGTFLLPRIIGLGPALEMLLTGKSVEAQEAYRLGLVSKVVPHKRLMEEAVDLADRLARGPSTAIGLIKRNVYKGLAIDFDSELELEADAFAHCTQTEDFQEGVQAILEKRKPRFSGR
jgi:2-(1,2-epoxy-1,2-dihydrophenyl)acetyl-CoA isomerase